MNALVMGTAVPKRMCCRKSAYFAKLHKSARYTFITESNMKVAFCYRSCNDYRMGCRQGLYFYL